MEIHRFNVLLRILKGFLVLIFISHGLYTDVTLVNTYDLLVALLYHLFRHAGITTSCIEDFTLLINVRSYNILNSAKSLVPIEGLRVSKLDDQLYLVYLSSQYSTLPYWLICLFVYLGFKF